MPINSSGFTIRCPDRSEELCPITEIHARGHIPLVLEQDVVIELSPAELSSGWRQTSELGPKRLGNLVAKAAARIQAALDDDISEATPELAADTTAFFLFALRQQGFASVKALRPLSLQWTEAMPNHSTLKLH